MRSGRSRPILAAAALAFAASLLLYSGRWIAGMWPLLQKPTPTVELGFNSEHIAAQHADLITSVYRNSPAEKAGMRVGDRLVAIDGIRLTDADFQSRVWMLHKPGDQIHLEIERAGAEAPVYLTGIFRSTEALPGKQFFGPLNALFPLPFLVVGLTVLFMRLEDPFAWLLALIFAGVIAGRAMPAITPRPWWWNAAIAYEGILLGMLGPLFYWLYARFPQRSPLDRSWPKLKWVFGGLGLLMSVGSTSTGGLTLPTPLRTWLGKDATDRIALLIAVVCMTMGLVSFAANYFSAPDVQSQRRMRVMFWGTILCLGPNLLKLLVQSFISIKAPPWMEGLLTVLLFLTPVVFAYAVVVHRVLEIPVLIRRSARYLLVQRGFTILLSLGSIGLTLLFALSLPRYLEAAQEVSQPSSIALGAVFGTALLWAGTQVHRRVSSKIDRAFFRSAYDARMILEDLAEKTRTATSRPVLARLLETHLHEALKPRFLVVQLQPETAAPAEAAECVVAIPASDGKPAGAILLGPRLSEEPYSSEDRRLLASIASQAATALENMRLAGEIAEGIERERRSARELDIARDVQNRLLPQAPPHLGTLDVAACCIQARSVGGDYYDFLDLGPQKVGLVLGDVSGKGVHAALLMANLEAYLRSQCSMSPLDPVRALQHVNLMLCRGTAAEHFATLFFGIYDDITRELLYVNCGHNPPVWVRADGSVARLQPTATVIGAFERWSGTACSVRLAPDDLLVIYSDGVTEAPRGEEDFGERRLIDLLTAANGSPAQSVVSEIVGRVQEFSAGAQADDLTLLVARAK